MNVIQFNTYTDPLNNSLTRIIYISKIDRTSIQFNSMDIINIDKKTINSSIFSPFSQIQATELLSIVLSQ